MHRGEAGKNPRKLANVIPQKCCQKLHRRHKLSLFAVLSDCKPDSSVVTGKKLQEVNIAGFYFPCVKVTPH